MSYLYPRAKAQGNSIFIIKVFTSQGKKKGCLRLRDSLPINNQMQLVHNELFHCSLATFSDDINNVHTRGQIISTDGHDVVDPV